MWQVACIEAFDLLDARSGILGEIDRVGVGNKGW